MPKYVKFIITEKFKFGDSVYNAGEILTISEADLEKEVAKGKHPTNGTWLSGVLNHGRKLDEAVQEDADRIADDKAKIQKGAA